MSRMLVLAVRGSDRSGTRARLGLGALLSVGIGLAGGGLCLHRTALLWPIALRTSVLAGSASCGASSLVIV